jgi:hypothetical protein
MGLHLFKLKGNETYVSPIAPKALEAGADELDQSIAKRAAEGEFTRKTLLEDMRPGVAFDSAVATEFLTHLERMVSGGSLVELHTGVLAVPRAAAAPAAGGKPEEKADAGAEEGKVADTTEAPEAPEVPEAPETPETPEAPDTAEAPKAEAPETPEAAETPEAPMAEAAEPAEGEAVAEAPAEAVEEKAEDAAAPVEEVSEATEEPKADEARLEAALPEAVEGAVEAPEMPAAEEDKSGESGEGGAP